MKKLLLILLLLFPAHIAWANIFKIHCTDDPGAAEAFYVLDTKKKIVKNQNGIVVSKNLVVNEDSYVFYFDQIVLDTFNSESRYQNLSAKVVINRNTLSMVSIHKFKDLSTGEVHNPSFNSKCELIKKRKI